MIDENKMNNIDANYALLYKTYELCNYHIRQEINSNGDCFDFKSQDCFKDSRKALTTLELSEKIFSEDGKPERKELRKIIIKEVQTYIELYEQYRHLFNSYDRHSLMLMQYRKFYNLSPDVSSEDILKTYSIDLGLVNPNKYFDSNFYNNIDFVSVDYHYFFYRYACFLKLLITKNLEFKYEDEYLIKKTNIFIHDSLLHFIYHKLSDILFEPVSEYKFVSFFNLKNDFITLKIKNSQNNKVYGLIGKLYSLVDDEYKEIWINNVLKNLHLQKSTYDRKNKEYLKAEKGDKLNYKNKVETLFEKYNELNNL